MHVFFKWTIALCLSLVMPLAFADNVHGILRVVKGDVQIKSAKTGTASRARIGEKVFPKDIISTGKDARAKIVMVDNNEINVSPNSQIEIQHYEYDPAAGKKEVLLNVLYGKVRSKVEQKYDGKTSKFQIKTPSAVAGVRGTDFITSYTPSTNSSSIVTFEGRVEFGIPGPNGTIANAVFVAPGQQASNNGTAAPSTPAPVPRDELVKMDNDTKSEPPKMNAVEPKQDQRTPATDDKKKDEGNKPAPTSKAPAAEGSGANKSPGSTSGAPAQASNPAAAESGRAPSSTSGGGSMFRPEDFAGSKNAPNMPAVGPTMPVMIPQVIPVVNLPGLPCDFCRENLTGQTKLIIKVNAQ